MYMLRSLRKYRPSVRPPSLGTRLEHWQRDLRFAARSIRRSPGFAAAVILTLGLGLGTNAVVFSLLDDIFFRPPAGVPHPERVRRVWREIHAAYGQPIADRRIAYHEYAAIAGAVADRATLALYGVRSDVRFGRGDSAPVVAAYTTANYFDALGGRPARGRTFTDDEANIASARPLVVISDAFWRAQLGAQPTAIGRSITLDDRDYEIIGIAPIGFRGVDLSDVDLWLPIGAFPTRDTPRVSFWESSVVTFDVFARVNTGSIEALNARASTAYRVAPTTDFAPDLAGRIFFEPIVAARGPGARPQEMTIVLRLSLVSAVILLITIANVVNLLLGRVVSRRQESAIRLALGAGRAEVARASLTEAVLLAVGAGVAALVAAYFSAAVLRGAVLPDVHISAAALRAPVVLLVALLSLVAGLIAGAVPAMQASNPNVGTSLRSTSATPDPRRRFIAAALVVAQTALSTVLLVGAVLLVQSARNVGSINPGFATDRLGLLSIELPAGQRADTAAFSVAVREVGDRIRALPGVESVAQAWDTPIHGMGGRVKLYTATDSSEAPGRENPTGMRVSSSYFTTLGTKVLRGRVFDDSPTLSSNAVVVNAVVAQMFWPDREAVGQCVYIQKRDACSVVVGVVENSVRDNVLEPPAPQIYLPIFGSSRGQRPPAFTIVRAQPRALAGVMAQSARLLHEVFPRGTPHVTLLADRLSADYRPWRLASTLFMLFGSLALAVAVLGTYSVVSYTVTERWREVGIRVALGAGDVDVARQVLRWGLGPVMIGAVAGVVLAIAGARLLASLLYGIDARNPLISMGVIAVVLLASLVASLIPAWRATRVDPAIAMLVQ
jgi:predicted permease